MFKRFLVPVDYSAASRTVLKEAIELATELQADIVLLHVEQPVVEPSVSFVAPMAGIGNVQDVLWESAQTYLDSLEPMFGAVPHRVVLRTGLPAEDIVTLAEREGADLIVMASNVRSGFVRLVMGSTTEEVTRHSSIPVLSIPVPDE